MEKVIDVTQREEDVIREAKEIIRRKGFGIILEEKTKGRKDELSLIRGRFF